MHGGKIGPFGLLETEFADADPIVFSTPGIDFLDNEIPIAAFPLPGQSDAPGDARRQVDVEKSVRREPLGHDFGRQPSGENGRRAKIFHLVRGPLQGKCEGGHPHQSGFQGSGDRSRVGNVIAEISSAVDPGNDQVRTAIQKPVNTEVDAIGGGAVDGEDAGAYLLGPQRMMKGERMAGRASFPIGRDDNDPAQGSKSFGQHDDAGGMDAIIVCDQNQHQCLNGEGKAGRMPIMSFMRSSTDYS